MTLTTIPGASNLYRKNGTTFLNIAVDASYASTLAGELKSMTGHRLNVSIKVDKPKRSSGHNRIFHSICRQIAQDIYKREIANNELSESDALDLVKDGVKWLAVEWGYPTVYNKTRRRKEPARSRNRTTREFCVLVEAALAEAAANQVDVREDVIQWDHWRSRNTTITDSPTYKNSDEYRDRHPFCEACLTWLGDAGELAHIRSVGAGGIDDASNWLRLCVRCHRQIMHQDGWGRLMILYPRITEKVNAALRNDPNPTRLLELVPGDGGPGEEG